MPWSTSLQILGGFLDLIIFCFDPDGINRGRGAHLALLCGREDNSALRALHTDPRMGTKVFILSQCLLLNLKVQTE